MVSTNLYSLRQEMDESKSRYFEIFSACPPDASLKVYFTTLAPSSKQKYDIHFFQVCWCVVLVLVLVVWPNIDWIHFKTDINSTFTLVTGCLKMLYGWNEVMMTYASWFIGRRNFIRIVLVMLSFRWPFHLLNL